jgi:hypothetical protein
VPAPLQDRRIQLNPDLLWDLGFQSLTRAQVSDLLDEMYETLEFRVGMRLAEQMDDNQLATFERIVDGRDETKALDWLTRNFPHYREVVRDEFEHLKRTLRRAASLRKDLDTEALTTESSESSHLETGASE